MRKDEKTGEENHHFEVDSQRHEGKYQRFILARAWTRLIKDGKMGKENLNKKKNDHSDTSENSMIQNFIQICAFLVFRS